MNPGSTYATPPEISAPVSGHLITLSTSVMILGMPGRFCLECEKLVPLEPVEGWGHPCAADGIERCESFLFVQKAWLMEYIGAGCIKARAAGFPTCGWFKTGRGVLKQHECASCGDAIAKGARAYRPLSNRGDRGLRMCVPCGEDQ